MRALQHRLRDAVHLAAHARRARPSRGRRSPARDSEDISANLQLLVVQRRADAEVALRVRHQRLVQPRLLLGDGLAQASPPPRRAARGPRRQLPGVGHDELVDQLQHAAVLLGHRLARGSSARARGRGWRASARTARAASPCVRWPTSGAAASARTRAPSGCRSRRRPGRCRPAGPRPSSANVSRVPEVAVLSWLRRISASTWFSRESFAGIQRIELGEHALAEVDELLAARGAEVVDLAVEAVVADLGGADRRQLEPAVEPALGQVGERVGLGGIGRGGGRGAAESAAAGASAFWQAARLRAGRGRAGCGAFPKIPVAVRHRTKCRSIGKTASPCMCRWLMLARTNPGAIDMEIKT